MHDQLQSRLAAYYAGQVGAQAQVSIGPLVALTGGWASSLYSFSIQSQPGDVDRQTLVLKIYTPTPRGREHAIREWQALTRLRAVGYLVPRASLFEPDQHHLGSPFIVMEHVPGRQLWQAIEQASQPMRGRLTRLFVERLVELHRLAPQVLDPQLGQAHPYAYIDRELEQLRRDGERSSHPTLIEVVAWLEQRKQAVPCDRPAILHRDYHPWNVLIDPAEHIWVIDWDWQFGDPRFDLAWTLTLMRRSGFHTWSAAVQEEYARQSDRPLDQLAYFEILTTLRWLLTVTHTLDSGEPQHNTEHAAFRAFLAEPVQQATAFLLKGTGINVEVIL